MIEVVVVVVEVVVVAVVRSVKLTVAVELCE